MRIRSNWRELLSALVGKRERAPVARAAKLNATFLRDILERNQTPGLKNAEKLSDALGVKSTDWFLEKELTPDSTSNWGEPVGSHPELPRFDQMPRDFPVYGSAECGEDGAFEFNTGEVIDLVKRPQRLLGVKAAYGLYVSGTSMVPWRKSGALVYVHEKQPPMIGDHVVIQLKPKKAGDAPLAYIKLLEKRTGTEIVVSQYNPPKRITFPMSKVVSIHRVIEWEEALGI
jgi:phage repressor protein C with HTH and peptisase S24 domain